MRLLRVVLFFAMVISLTSQMFSETVISNFKYQQSVAGLATTVTSGSLDNPNGGMTATFELLITGTPSAVSIVISGCMRGGTCDVLETYATVANSNRHPTIATVYDYFTVVPTFTTGTSPRLAVNFTIR